MHEEVFLCSMRWTLKLRDGGARPDQIISNDDASWAKPWQIGGALRRPASSCSTLNTPRKSLFHKLLCLLSTFQKRAKSLIPLNFPVFALTRG
jgi:hypothetical protein